MTLSALKTLNRKYCCKKDYNGINYDERSLTCMQDLLRKITRNLSLDIIFSCFTICLCNCFSWFWDVFFSPQNVQRIERLVQRNSSRWWTELASITSDIYVGLVVIFVWMHLYGKIKIRMTKLCIVQTVWMIPMLWFCVLPMNNIDVCSYPGVFWIISLLYQMGKPLSTTHKHYQDNNCYAIGYSKFVFL